MKSLSIIIIALCILSCGQPRNNKQAGTIDDSVRDTLVSGKQVLTSLDVIPELYVQSGDTVLNIEITPIRDVFFWPESDIKVDISPKDLGNSLHGIDLFGVDMKGSPEHILQELKKDSYIKIDKGQDSLHQLSENTFFCKVYFGSIPFGMNLHYDKDNNSIIKSINFLTSESSDTVIDTIVNSLSDYYGEPDIKDFESYTWFLESKREIRARRLHSEDGGWTISIY